jgi:hypothetical protein
MSLRESRNACELFHRKKFALPEALVKPLVEPFSSITVIVMSCVRESVNGQTSMEDALKLELWGEGGRTGLPHGSSRLVRSQPGRKQGDA